jgi:7-cyano-7-deazaguanine synthase
MKLNPNQALIVHSGGADSTICLHWAIQRFESVQAITFDYGQRHIIELEAAADICSQLSITQKVVPINSFSALGGNSLVDHEQSIATESKELPNTFVPGRNLIFMTFAAAWAYQISAKHLVTGVCQTDFSGYPDCRADTMTALKKSMQLGMEADFELHTPLMDLNKAESILMAQKLTGCMDSLALSHTCYEGQRPPCGACPSCILRAKGFAEVGVSDPLLTVKN